jgi:hypothetical protein
MTASFLLPKRIALERFGSKTVPIAIPKIKTQLKI